VPEPSPPATATLTGTVTYRQRIALPPEAIVTVRLEDTSLADAPAVPVVQYSFGAEGRQVPLPFEFTFDPASIKDGNTYSVRASIEIEGELRWTSTTAYHVLTRGNPSQVDIVVDPVNAAPPEPPAASATRLRDTEWMLVEFDGRPVPPPVEGGRAPMIVFATEGSAVSAQGHCNRHFGSFEADDAAGTLVIRMVGSTKMGCPNEVMMEEAEFLAARGEVHDRWRDADARGRQCGGEVRGSVREQVGSRRAVVENPPATGGSSACIPNPSPVPARLARDGG
jgi:putative lipoprotein